MNTRAVWIALLVGLLVGSLWLTPVAGQPAATSTAAENATPLGVTIASELTDTSGEQTVIVRLTEQSGKTIRTTRHDNRIGAMKSHAATAQSPFEHFAASNPHIDIKRSFWLTNALVVTVDTDHVLVKRLGTVDNVERIHDNYNLSAATTTASTVTNQSPTTTPPAALHQPTARSTTQLRPTTSLKTTDGLAQIKVSGAWNYTRGKNTSIAVIDTGVDPTHPDIDIKPTNWNDWDKNGNPRETTPQDYGSHGTHVSGTAVGGSASGTHIGVAPEAELYHGAALNQNCKTRCDGTLAQLIAGMQWAVEEDVEVLSMSLGGVEESDNFIDDIVPVVRNAQDAGTIVVAAAGNKPIDTTTSPANVYDSISVGATDTDGTIADFSSSETIDADAWDDPPADWPDTYTVPTVAAPGSNINSSLPDDRYGRLSGTSMATPHVSGTVALMRAASSEELSPDEIKSTLESTAVDTGDEPIRQGAGIIDAKAAVGAVATRANITATITDAPGRVTVGRELAVMYSATNIGSEVGDAALIFRVNETAVKTANTGKLNPNESTTGTFSYRPTRNQTGLLTVGIESDSSTDSQAIRVVPPSVELTDIGITPQEVTGTTTTHTLNATILNVSDDGQPETVTITMPEGVSAENSKIVSVVDARNMPISKADATVNDESEITVMLSPDTDAEIRDVSLRLSFDARTT